MKPASLALLGVASGLLVLVAAGLGAHSGFSPAYQVRSAAPALAIVAGGVYAHAVARVRAEQDAARQVDPSGRALFLGLVMVVVALLAWLACAQAAPALLNVWVGRETPLQVQVVRRLPADAGSAECAWRVEVDADALGRTVDECVARGVWELAQPGRTLRAQAISSVLGVEIASLGE